jgi:ArsR family transcriptional regulator, arsenate/arsenite/antimonite-responsive transcriptional repressor
MKKTMDRRYDHRARLIKSLAHPSRLLIVDKLSEHERSVGELTKLVGAEMSTVSKHLGVLKNAGVVQDHKRGASVYYSLCVPCILNIFTCADAALTAIAREQQSPIAASMKGKVMTV